MNNTTSTAAALKTARHYAADQALDINATAERVMYINDNGLNGKGHQIFTVFTTYASGRGHMQAFGTRAEARNWLKWS